MAPAVYRVGVGRVAGGPSTRTVGGHLADAQCQKDYDTAAPQRGRSGAAPDVVASHIAAVAGDAGRDVRLSARASRKESADAPIRDLRAQSRLVPVLASGRCGYRDCKTRAICPLVSSRGRSTNGWHDGPGMQGGSGGSW